MSNISKSAKVLIGFTVGVILGSVMTAHKKNEETLQLRKDVMLIDSLVEEIKNNENKTN